MNMNRRLFLGGALALGAPGCAIPDQSPSARLAEQLRRIEGLADGTLGVEIYDTDTGYSAGLNRDRRFGHASSFKLSLAALALARHPAGTFAAARLVRWSAAELLPGSPFTSARLSEGATVLELAEAAQVASDKTAANVLLRELGGPAALSAFWRSLGDTVSRLDRTEPTLNNVPVSEFRDTTTPAAMARTVAKLVYGEVLPPPGRALLREWMIATQNGARRVRAGLPEGWVAGDKTGTALWPGNRSFYADIGFAEGPEGAAPVTFASYFVARTAQEEMDPAAEAALARVASVIRAFVSRDEGLPLVGRLY